MATDVVKSFDVFQLLLADFGQYWKSYRRNDWYKLTLPGVYAR